jgi:hypothetical protein
MAELETVNSLAGVVEGVIEIVVVVVVVVVAEPEQDEPTKKRISRAENLISFTQPPRTVP